MNWRNADGIRRHLAGVPFDYPINRQFKPTRKVVYSMVGQGMRVAYLGSEPRRDSKGRLRRGRMMFATEWADEFLAQRATHV